MAKCIPLSLDGRQRAYVKVVELDARRTGINIDDIGCDHSSDYNGKQKAGKDKTLAFLGRPVHLQSQSSDLQVDAADSDHLHPAAFLNRFFPRRQFSGPELAAQLYRASGA